MGPHSDPGIGSRSLKSVAQTERVRIFSEFSVHRGGRSMLDVQLRAIALLLASPVAWEYYINLSDTHYPADAASWFASYLWLHQGTNYARITSTKYYDPTLQGGRHATYSGPRAEDVYIACDRSLAFECDGQLFSLTPGEKFPALFAGVTSASGPEWVILSRSFLAYVDEGLKEGASLVSRLYDDLVSLSIPEETFFQTLLLTSPFCNTLLRHEFLYLDLYDAPWRTSPQSDFPFQSPRRLNVTHLPDIAKEKPWFVRKIDAAQPGSAALRASLEVARSPNPLAAVARPRYGTAGPSGPSLRRARAAGSLLLTERAAVARREALPREVLPPVVALRVGCGWDEDAYQFRGDVSLIDASDCPNASLVSYLNNVEFEGEVAIHWYLDGHLQRQSGGKIPKGFSMFVDNLRDPVPGQWSVRLTDVTSGHRIGERGFIVYDARDVRALGAGMPKTLRLVGLRYFCFAVIQE
ncbi:XYLT2 [Symbiodinium sp. KB8]|nr:XYLT2 [Symbiodinium sp. KB8]